MPFPPKFPHKKEPQNERKRSAHPLSSCRSPGGSEARSKRSRVGTRYSSSPTPDLPYVFVLYSVFLSPLCCSLSLRFFPGRIITRERPSKQIGRVMFLFLSLTLSLFCARARAHRNHRLVLTIKLSRCSLFSNALSRCNDNNNTIKQSSGPPPEKIVTLAGIIAPRMVRKFLVTFFTRS